MIYLILGILGIIFFVSRMKKNTSSSNPNSIQGGNNINTLSESSETRNNNICPHCGAKVNEGMIYCENCGGLIKNSN